MRRILTKVLTFYWMTAFAAMAYACIADQGRGIGRAFHLLGSAADLSKIGETGGTMLAGLFGIAFALGALLFLWSLITDWMETGISRDADEVLRLAMAFGGCVFTALLLVAAVFSVSGIFAAVTLHLIAMLTSYLAVHAERAAAASKDVEAEKASELKAAIAGRAAQLMAANAARQYSRIRLATSNVHPIRGDR